MTTLEAYDPATDTWTVKTPMSTPRWLDGAAVIKSTLYVVGTDYCAPSTTVEAYNPHTDTWTAVTPMLTPRRPVVAVMNDVLYAIGGGNTLKSVNANEAFYPTPPAIPLEFTGFLPPIGGADSTGGSFANPLRTFKMGSTIPVKFTISQNGSLVTTGVHTLEAIRYGDATTPATPLDATPQGSATAGNQFQLTDAQWQFNLDSKATGMSVGMWQLVLTLSDGSQHIGWIQLK